MTPYLIIVAIVVLPFALFALAAFLAWLLKSDIGFLAGAKIGGYAAVAVIVIIFVVVSVAVALYEMELGKLPLIAFPGAVVFALWCSALGATCGPIVEFGWRKTQDCTGAQDPEKGSA